MESNVIEVAEGLAAELRALVAGLDPNAIPACDALTVWSAFDRIERGAAAAKLLVARKVDESREATRAGVRSTAELLARRAGTSIGAARADLDTSKRLAKLPATDAALRDGRISRQQAAAIAPAGAADPAAERSLIESAATSTLRELTERCARVRAAADPDPDDTKRRIHRERRVREWTDANGFWNLFARGPVAAGAGLKAALARLIDERMNEARRAGEHEPREAYAFDALMALAQQRPATTATPAKPNPRFLAVLRVDLATLVRGRVHDGETCEIAGYGPVPADAARRILGDAIVKLIVTRGVDVLNVTHLGRGPTAAQKVALLWAQSVCVVEGCDNPRVEHDHREDWARTHTTRLELLDNLCSHHHGLKTTKGWALVAGTGKRRMVPPDHAEHPANSPPASRTDAEPNACARSA